MNRPATTSILPDRGLDNLTLTACTRTKKPALAKPEASRTPRAGWPTPKGPMAQHVVATIAAVVVMVMLGSCQSGRPMMGVAAKPSASVRGAHLVNINTTSASMAFEVDVINPYAVPLPLANANYRLSSAGKKLVSGKADLTGEIPAHQSKTITLPAEVKYSEVLSALNSVTPGSVIPYTAELTLWVNAPEAGPLMLNLRNIEGQLPVPASPLVSLTGITWESLSLDQAKATMRLHVVNRNQFALTLAKLNYALALGEVSIVKAGAEQAISFSAGGANDLSIPLSFSPKSLGVGVFNMLTGKGSQYHLKGDMNLTSPYGPVTLHFEQRGQTIFTH